MNTDKKKLLIDLKNLSEAEGYVKGLSKSAMSAFKKGYEDLAKELADEASEITDNLLKAVERVKKEVEELNDDEA